MQAQEQWQSRSNDLNLGRADLAQPHAYVERDPDEPFSSVSWETTADRHTVPMVMVGSVTGALPALTRLILMVMVREVL